MLIVYLNNIIKGTFSFYPRIFFHAQDVTQRRYETRRVLAIEELSVLEVAQRFRLLFSYSTQEEFLLIKK